MAMDGITVALAGLLFLELHFEIEPTEVRAQRSAWTASQTQYLQASNFAAPQPAVSALRNMMLSRPLFDPSRRPPLAPTEDPTAPMEIPRLSGIMVTPTEKIAVFSPAVGAPIIVNEKGRFGPFMILAISDESVTIKTPGGVFVLRSDSSALGEAGASTPKSTLVADGISLNLIKVRLPKAVSWQGLPPVH